MLARLPTTAAVPATTFSTGLAESATADLDRLTAIPQDVNSSRTHCPPRFRISSGCSAQGAEGQYDLQPKAATGRTRIDYYSIIIGSFTYLHNHTG